MLSKNLSNSLLKLPPNDKKLQQDMKQNVLNKKLVVVLNVKRLQMKQKLKRLVNVSYNFKLKVLLLRVLVKQLLKQKHDQKQLKLKVNLQLL
jgi:hypothetical protein